MIGDRETIKSLGVGFVVLAGYLLFSAAFSPATDTRLVAEHLHPPRLPLEEQVSDEKLPMPISGPMAGSDTDPFPEAFVFGTATAAYQIEGAANEGGRGSSIWDVFSKTPGKVAHGENGDVACDHYHRYKQDVQLIKNLGTRSYRFSIAWPRILPDGVKGGVNKEGVQFYSSLIDELIANGIEPMVTLYHWDLPTSVHDSTGGWASKHGEVATEFEAYARVCFKEFGNRVRQWITLNEPWCSSLLAFGTGEHAPGKTDNAGVDPYRAAHNLLRAHAKAVHVYRSEFAASQKGKIGITLNSDFAVAKVPGLDGEKAVRRYMEFNLGWFAGPVYNGDYPEIMRSTVGERLPTFTDDEKAALKGSSDFFGLNHYSTHIVSPAPANSSSGTSPTFFSDLALTQEADKSWPVTDMGLCYHPRVAFFRPVLVG